MFQKIVSMARRVRRAAGLVAGLGVAAIGVGQAPGAMAQNATPSVKIGTAPFISPVASNTWYGTGTTATYSLGATYERRAEVKELARALNNDVDKIYDYVRNNVEISWTYGLQKGPVGAIVDKSGTAFDQASLMVELLRESGYTANYRVGYITLTPTQFQDWSGIIDAKAACQMLSSGGIPGVVNGTTNATCAYTGNLTSIKVAHIWVSVVIGGTTYLFDPAYKPSTRTAGVNLKTVANMATDEPLTSASSGATTGTDTGVDYVKNLNAEQLNSKLTTYADNIQSYIETNLPDGKIEDVIGDETIVREEPASPLRQTALPYLASQQKIWTGRIPDLYRTSLRVQITKPDTSGVFNTIIDKTFYVDEIYGAKLVWDTNFDANTNGDTIYTFIGNLNVVGPNNSLLFSTGVTDGNNPKYSHGVVTLTANLPYATPVSGATLDGTYMDVTSAKQVTYATPLTIMNAWGKATPALVAHWGSRNDKGLPPLNTPACELCVGGFVASAGDAKREQMAVSWMAQASKAAEIQSRMSGTIFQHHYSLGVVSADAEIATTAFYPPGTPNQKYGYSITESYDRIDIDSGFSLTPKVADAAGATTRRAGVFSIAATMEALEASVAAQVQDLPDTSSTSTRFEWGNRPPTAEDPSGGAGSRRFYEFNNGNVTQALPLARVEAATTTSNDGKHDGHTDEIGANEYSSRRNALANAITAYVGAGYDVVSSEEAFLGPGQRAGAFKKVMDGQVAYHFEHYYSKQRGGALVAVKYASGEPTDIAFVVVGPDGTFKGGGGGAQVWQKAQYDPAKAADVMKTRFVDRSTAVGVDLKKGGVTYKSPAILSVGSGQFPEKLDAELFWRGGLKPTDAFGLRSESEPQAPWSTNWNNSLSVSGSGLEAMGETDIRATAGALASFLAAQEVYRSAPSAERDVAGMLVNAWWLRQLQGNTVSVNVGADTRQFVRKYNGQWFAPGAGGYATLTQTGSRVVYVDNGCVQGGEVTYITTRGWNSAGVSYAVTNANGDVQNFGYWSKQTTDGVSSCANNKGFRLNSWVFPQGITVNLTYTPTGNNWGLDPLSSVSNSLGRQITFIDSGLGGFTDGTRSVTVTPNDEVYPTQYIHTDATGAQSKYDVSLVGGEYRLNKVYAPDNLTTPAIEYTYDALGRVKEAKDAVALQEGGRLPYEFRIAEGVRGERADPQTPTRGRYTVMYDDEGHPFRVIDEIGRKTEMTYDGRGRVTGYTYPEGDKELLAYDNRNNVITMTKKAKPGSLLADIVVSATYDTTWNKPLTITDPLNNVTDFTYFSTGNGKSLMATAKRPDPEGTPIDADRPLYQFTYNAAGQLLTMTDPEGLVTQNAYTNGYLTSTAVDPSGVNAVTTMTYTSFGDVASVDGPRTDVTDISYTIYDAARRKTFEIGADPDAAGALLRPVTKTTYDLRGQPVTVEKGKGAATDGSDFVALQTETTTYSPTGKPIKKVTAAGVTQASYDAADRTLCTAVRMNPAVYASLPASACSLSTSGADGPDRITKTEYDLAGQALKTIQAYNTADQRDYATYQYTLNGQQDWVQDARGNRSDMNYDGFDRLEYLYFPVIANNGQAASATDYEQYGYDAAGKRTSVRRRDAQVIAYQYDRLGREIVKDIPGGTSADVRTRYDRAGKIVSSLFNDVAGQGTTITYDTAGRMQTETAFGKALSYQYDKAGNRTRITWPDAYYAQWTYDALGRPKSVGENGATSGVGLLATYTYDDLGRRGSMVRGNGTTTGYSYDTADRLTGLTQDLASTTYDQTYGFGYNPASQILTRTTSNSLFQWVPPPAGTSTSNSYDGLNRDAAIAALPGGYDDRGNLTDDGSRTFVYDIENRLISVGGSTSLALSYDTIGRLRQTTTSATTSFLYDGPNLIGEYDGAGNLVRRYVHGPNTDEPLVWYEGSGTTDRRWLHADWQGTIIAQSNSVGAVTQTYAYGPWGEPKDDVWTGSRFRYTGQTMLPEAKLYHYKARVYDPYFGRFLQTDPVGYKDDLDLYAYVGDDPVNKTDPTGALSCPPACSVVVAPAAAPATATATAATGTAVATAVTVGGVVAMAAPLRGDTRQVQTLYVTYTRTNPETGQTYSGRTSGEVPANVKGAALRPFAEAFVAKRTAQQPILSREGFKAGRVESFSTNYFAVRGREQQLINYNGGAQSRGGFSRNKIDGISRWNPARYMMMGLAQQQFGYLQNNAPHDD